MTKSYIPNDIPEGSAERQMKKILYDAPIEHKILQLVDQLPDVCRLRFGKILSKIILRSNPLKAVATALLAKDYDVVAPHWFKYGRLIVLLLGAANRKKIILIEFIDYNTADKNPLIAFIYDLYIKSILAPCMRRSVLGIQVMTQWEKDRLHSVYNMPESSVRCIRWPIAGWEQLTPTNQAGNGTVFSSGRSACDWDTLFAAARLGRWPLTVVCSKKDLPHVKELNKTVGAAVYSEISVKEHDRLLAEASVCVICLKEANKSSGQIRLGACITLSVPCVVTAVRGMDGYLIDGVTGCSVPPRDAGAICRAVERLIADRRFCNDLLDRGRKHVSSYNKDHYVQKIINLLFQEAGPYESRIV